MKCKNILVIEDDLNVRQMMQDVLEIYGYSVSTAANGAEGIEKLKTMNPAPSVVLLDLMMPIMNGWQFLNYQRNNPKYAHIPVVVCSAYSEHIASVKPAAFIIKPTQLNCLIDAIKRISA